MPFPPRKDDEERPDEPGTPDGKPRARTGVVEAVNGDVYGVRLDDTGEVRWFRRDRLRHESDARAPLDETASDVADPFAAQAQEPPAAPGPLLSPASREWLKRSAAPAMPPGMEAMLSAMFGGAPGDGPPGGKDAEKDAEGEGGGKAPPFGGGLHPMAKVMGALLRPKTFVGATNERKTGKPTPVGGKPPGAGKPPMKFREPTRPERRADMEEKARSFAEMEAPLAAVLAHGAAALVADLRAQVRAHGIGTAVAGPDAIAALKPSPGLVDGIRWRVERSLQAAYVRGAGDARGEVDRARAEFAEMAAGVRGDVERAAFDVLRGVLDATTEGES